MNKPLKIKVCGMKNPDNREELESLTVDLFGFIFYPPSPRYVGGMAEETLFRLTHTGKEKVAVFVNEDTETVIHLARKYGFSHVQLHGHETPESCEQIRSAGFRVIKVFHIRQEFDFETTRPYSGVADCFLFERGSEGWGGSGRKFDWQILGLYRLEVPFFLSGGIAPGDEEAIAAISHPAFYGIDLNSGFEEEAGVKNWEKTGEFIGKLMKIRNKR